jgi:hypothetical protein
VAVHRRRHDRTDVLYWEESFVLFALLQGNAGRTPGGAGGATGGRGGCRGGPR